MILDTITVSETPNDIPTSPNTPLPGNSESYFASPPLKGALRDNPETHHLQSPIGFRMFIKRSPDVNYFAHKFTLPAIALPSADEATPYIMIPKPGDHMIFNPLVFSFQVEEGLKNYFDIVNWMKILSDIYSEDLPHIGPGEAYGKLASRPSWTQEGLKSDILISIEDAAKNALGIITFKDCWPTSLSELDWDVTPDKINYLEATVSFRYTLYEWRLKP